MIRWRAILVRGIGVWARGSRAFAQGARGLLLTGGILPIGAVLAGLALLGASVPASAQALTWSVVPSPSPGSQENLLIGVSCASAGACMAVGTFANTPGVTRALTERWDGTSWSVVPGRNRGSDELRGVSCTSAAACTAVGDYKDSSGVTKTLIETWNGTRWSLVPSPNRGTYNELDGVSCASATSCTAVGDYLISGGDYHALTESWNGTSWSVTPNPGSANSFLYDVSCVSAGACTAVGYYPSGSVWKTLIESWNGTSWSVVPSPSPGSFYNQLVSVSCASTAACTAVGLYIASDTAVRTLIESWNGTSWSVVPSPNPGTMYNQLQGVSCASLTACTAVGWYYRASSTRIQRTLIESWNGTSWSVVPSPNRGARYNELDGVSCASAATCTATGSHGKNGHWTVIESGTARG